MALASSAAVAAAAAAAQDSVAPTGALNQFGNGKDSPTSMPSHSHGLTPPISSVFPNSLRPHQLTSSGRSPSELHGNTSKSASDFSSVSHGGAFKPIVCTEERRDINGFQSSAFLPPKCPKLEPCPTTPHSELSSHLQTALLRMDEVTSDKSNDRSGVATPVSTDGSESGHRSTPEEGRRLRGKKRSPLDSQAPCCPVCGVTIRAGELMHHFALEVDRLQHISKSNSRRSTSRDGASHCRYAPSPNGSRRRNSPSTSSSDSKCSSASSRWDTYQRVKTNRTNRLGIKACKGTKRRRFNDDAACPVCGEKLCGSPDEMNVHVEICLRKKEMLGSEDENVEVDGSDKFEEYEWAGQTRIRATSLLEGGFSGSGLPSVSKSKEDDEDEDIDLNVDVDDSATFGTSQYSEADIIPCSSDGPVEQKQRDALRDAVLGGENTKHTLTECSKWSNDDCISSENRISDNESQPSATSNTSNEKGIVDSLKRKIKELDETSKCSDKLKCLICMESYTNPLVSVSCWHVHCEECWLRTLGAKKLCPQCNMITSPSDLRRVYL